MYTLSLWMEFIRILSPSKAPPVLRFDGSTETRAILLSGKSDRNLLTSSSTIEDFPEPPVPVMPNTGTSGSLLYVAANSLENASASFSAAVIDLAISRMFLSPNRSSAPSRSEIEGTVS